MQKCSGPSSMNRPKEKLWARLCYFANSDPTESEVFVNMMNTRLEQIQGATYMPGIHIGMEQSA